MGEQITRDDFLDTCHTNGLLYIVVAYDRVFPPHLYAKLPCKNIEHGREIIRGFEEDGVEGYFYIRKLSFQEDSWITRIKNWLVRYR